VNNVAPLINSVTGPTVPLQLGTETAISVSYSDVGTLDTHTATITWDDGSSSPATCAAGDLPRRRHAACSCGSRRLTGR
jgi:hypothetical protein